MVICRRYIMDLKNSIKVIVKGELFDENGDLKQRFIKHNLITNVGYDFLCNAFANATRPAAMEYIAVGTGTTTPALTDTALVTEIERLKAGYSHTASDKFLTLSATFAAGVATGALTEAGIFNAASEGTLFDRITYPVINKEQLDSYVISFTILFNEVETV